MTICEKLMKLRVSHGMTQEELAEELSVSRQSVSKWEMGQSLPAIDKALRLAELYGVSLDTLLREDTPLYAEQKKERHRYFGTDGFRGEANVDLTSMHAYRVGRFLGWYYGQKSQNPARRPRIVIGKDTRRSGYMLEYALAAGITASGADAYMLHVITTPGVSFVTRQDEFDAGVMITASHNPFYDNGIKVLNRYGEKLEDSTTEKIECYLDGDLAALGVVGEDLPLAKGERLGAIVDYVAGRNRYVAYLISLASHSYKSLRIGLDCANGASWMIANSVFSALGAQTVVIGAEPNGFNINRDCGSTHMERLCALVREEHLDFAFAFDGDADRCLAIDERGEVIDGDAILYILARRLQARGMLNRDTVVATVMSNSGFVASLKKHGISCETTRVGDRFVYECVQKNDYSLGGEQSGHIILKKYATTGDGLLTAVMLTEAVLEAKAPLSKLTDGLTLYPQRMVSIRVKDQEAVMNDPTLLALCKEIEREIAGQGRALLRKSGTEPVVRVMVECERDEDCQRYLDMAADCIRKGGHTLE